MTPAPSNPCLNTCPKPAGVEVGTVELATGATVCTWCPLWRQECQDRHNDLNTVMKGANRLARRSLTDSLGGSRGEVYKARLEAEIIRVWNTRFKSAG